MKKLLLFGLVATMFASCSTEVAEQVVKQTRDIPQSITINIEEGSRVYLENGKCSLNRGDIFHVFNKINHSDTYTYNGNTDANGNPIIELTTPTYYTTHTETDKVVVVYSEGTPTLSVVKENEEDKYGVVNSLKAIVKSTQKYQKNSFASGSAPMVYIGDNIDAISMKNVCGWINIQLTGNGQVLKKVELWGNKNEELATSSMVSSAATVSATDLSVSEIGYAFTKLTMNFDSPDALSSEVTQIIFSTLPVEFTDGFTVKITCTDGTVMTKTTNKNIKIGRNEIQPMTPFEYTGEQVKIDLSDLNTPIFRDLTYSEGYENTYEVKVANNNYQNGYFVFYNPNYQPSGLGDFGTLNGEYDIVVADIGDKFDKNTFIADNNRCYVPFEGEEFYFKSGKVTVSGSNANTKIAFNAVVTSNDGTELPLVGECTLNEMGYTTSESKTLAELGIVGFVYNTSTMTGTTTIQGYDKETSPTKLITIAMKCNNINNLYDKEFSTASSATNKITSGSLYLAEGTGVEYPYINGAVTVTKGPLKSNITFNSMKFIDSAGNIYNITNPAGGSTSVVLKQGSIQEVGGGW